MKKKRKPWRTFRKSLIRDRHIRRVCFLILAAELLMLGHQKMISFPSIEFSEDQEIIIYQLPAGRESRDGLTGHESSGRICGIRIRLKEGIIDFYRREETERPYDPETGQGKVVK